MNSDPTSRTGAAAPARPGAAAAGPGGPTRVLVLCPYPKAGAASQRFRFEQYLGILEKAGIETVVEPFLSPRAMSVLHEPGHNLVKISNVMAGFASRFLLMFRLSGYHYVFIHLQASPIGPPVFEFLLFLFGKKVVYDIDDAIFIKRASRSNPLVAMLKWTSKVKYIARHSHKVMVCNKFLLEWASSYNDHITLIPTTIDPDYHRPAPAKGAGAGMPVIGWTGSQSNLSYLDLVRPALSALQEKYDFEFRVICDVDPGFPELARYRFIKWRLETEIADLAALDIGLMPVPDGTWEKGKVGFKGIQYSALEIVPVVSSVGEGREVVQHGETGYVVDNSTGDWYRALENLLLNRELALAMGKSARERILKRYSVPAQAEAYISLFRDKEGA